MNEVYTRPQVVPRCGYPNPGYRITWTLDQKSIVTVSRFEESIKHRGAK